MNKKLLALKILLPILVVLLIAFLTLETKCLELHNYNGQGLHFAIAFLFNLIPMIATIVLGIATIVLFVLLLTLKKEMAVIICVLVALCLLIPFVGFSSIVDILALWVFIEVPIIAVVTLAVNVAAMILCCVIIHGYRKQKRNVDTDVNQIA